MSDMHGFLMRVWPLPMEKGYTLLVICMIFVLIGVKFLQSYEIWQRWLATQRDTKDRMIVNKPESQKLSQKFSVNFSANRELIPGRTVRADIRLDISNITDVRVELSVQPRTSAVNCAPKSVVSISAWISARISVLLRISGARIVPWISVVVRIIRHGHP